jgi:tetratricopeptide (TPR) repeat protein
LPEDPDRTRRPLLVAGLVLVALFAAGTFVPRDPDSDLLFGVEGYRVLGAPVFLVCAALLLAVLRWPGPAARLGERIAARLATAPRWLPPAGTLVATGCAFWLLRSYSLSGDAVTVVSRLAANEVYPSNALADYLFFGVSRGLALDPVRAVRIVSCLAGLVYVGCAIRIGRECAPPGPGRVALTALLLATGTTALFYGTIEVYAPLAAAIGLYLLLGIRWLGGRGTGVAPPLCLGVAFCLHGSAGLLLPSLLVLSARGPGRSTAFRRTVRWGGLFLLPVAAVFLSLFLGVWGAEFPEPGHRLYGTFLGAMDEGPLLPLLRSRENLTHRYAILDLEHVVGILNVLALVAPVGIVLLLTGRRPRRDPIFRFVAVAALFLLAFPFLWNTNFGLRRDWDLMSSMGIPITLLGGLALLRSGADRAGAVRIVALGGFVLLPFVLGNHLDPAKRYEYAKVLGERLQGALPETAGADVARAARVRARAEGLSEPDSLRDAWVDRLRRVASGSVISVGAFEVRGPTPDPDGFRERVREALGRSAAEIGDPPLLAEVLAEEVSAELERVRAAGPSLPPPGRVAYGATRRVLARRDVVGAIRHPDSPMGRELLLLDALDDAMSRDPGFRWREPRFDAEAFRSAVDAGVIATGGDRDAPPIEEAWKGMLVSAAEAVLDREKARERGDRWEILCRGAEALARVERALRPPGYGQAWERILWLWTGEKDLARAEVHARHMLERAPGDAPLTELLGAVVHELGRHEEGKALFREAIRLAPEVLSPRRRLATALLEEGDEAAAVACLEQAIRLNAVDPEVSFALLDLGWYRLDRGEPELAIPALRAAIYRFGVFQIGPEGEAPLRRARELLDRALRNR